MMKSILAIILLLVGAVALISTAYADVEQRVEYTTSLNSMASVVMNWYGSLITTNKDAIFVAVDNRWTDYRSHYPENISQIKITSSDLTKLEGSSQYQFKVASLISYSTAEGKQSQIINEIFVFDVSLLSLPVIKSLSLEKSEKVVAVESDKFTSSHYKAREFAYAWLAYLDGVELAPSLSSTSWIDTADYTLKIGHKKIQGSVRSIREQRKQYLTKGGHLLRSIDVEKKESKSTLLLTVIAEWKGVNQSGKPVLAKIRQEITVRVLEDQTWKVLAIDEQHLIPDIAPWIGLLC